MAKIVSGLVDAVPQGVVGNPAQLTVGKTTRLLLNVTRDNATSEHVVQGWLKKDSTAVSNRTVRLKVNETECRLTTDGSGHFSQSLDLQPKDNKPTLYMILASFEGDNAKNATDCAAASSRTQIRSHDATYHRRDLQQLKRVLQQHSNHTKNLGGYGWVRIGQNFTQ